MPTDIVTLGVKVDASTVDEADAKLDKLTATGARTENQMKQTGTASQIFAADVAKLKSSIDPAGYALDKVNVELAEADRLHRMGAISASEHAQAQMVLKDRAEQFAAQQSVMNARLHATAGAARLTGAEALNLSRQFADVGVSAAMGMNPLMILIQQGPQIADIMRTSGLSVKDVIIEMLRMAGIVKVVEAANDNLATSTSRTAIANAELAASNEAVAVTANHAASATARQTAATAANAVASKGAAAAAEGAAVAHTAQAGAATVAGNATRVAMGPLIPILAAIAAAVGLVTAGFALFARETNKGASDVAKELNLSEKQLERLKEKGVDTSVTIGDSFNGLMKTIKDIFVETFGPQLEWLEKTWNDVLDGMTSALVFTIKAIVGGFVGAVYAIRAGWQVLPGMLGDIAVMAANGVIAIVEDMVNKVIQKINVISTLVNGASEWAGMGQVFGQVDNVSVGRINNPWAGKAASGAAAISSGFSEGYQRGGAAVDRFGERWQNNSEDARNARVLEGAGDREKDSAGRSKSGGQSEFEKQVKAAEDYIKSLKEETEEIGKNAMELKVMASERAKALAPTKALRDEIDKQTEAWKQATANNALAEMTRDLQDQNDELEFENKILGMSNAERAKAIAQREIDIRLRDLEREGILITADLIEKETAAILKNVEAKGKLQDEADAARKAADDMGRLHDATREAADAFGELFGTAGRGFAELVDVITSYKDAQIEAEAEIAEARQRYGADSIQAKEAEARASEDMRRAELDYYGDMIGAAKRFFKEKSTGYKVLEAVERAYRAYQMVSMVIEAVNVAKSIVLDTTKTASSVANSATRASADGVAAIAKAIASLPFPFNIVAGAATAAALIAFGVKVFGGGGGKGAAAASEKEASKPIYNGPVDEYGAPTSSYSVLRPGATRASNDNSTYSPGASSVGSMGGVSIGGNTITIQGNMDQDAMPAFEEALARNKQETIDEARQLINEDISERNSRQRIGGAG